MFNRKTTELTQQHLAARGRERRNEELRRDPSDIPGMTQTELNGVIDSETISTKLLKDSL